ncbi:GDSL-type esterase/lipase family protein [Cellulomonas algicola]|uniref:SGNH/GDSL hydrolase family protein n=1 Tax=Cellulomonas algicola TaxID=2071633 RepID=UPI001C3FAA35|nr:SGNH/GDSL hydrolase family protein [Cellulomonas algicola]
MRIGRPARTLTVLVALGALTVTGAQAAPTQPDAPPAAAAGGAPAGPSQLPPGTDQVVEAPAVDDLTTEIPIDQRDATLGDGWETSTDQAWTLSGDPAGLHVLLADASDGYAWRTVATLAQPGIETDRWIGNACLTESGDRLVVAYAPRSFTNEPELFLQGAWTAVVDLTSGTVADLPVRGSLEYFTPSCGHDEDAVLTVSGGDELAATRLVTVDAVAATVDAPVDVSGQVTSAVPTGSGVVAAVGTQVARIDGAGHVIALARTTSVPYELTTDADGGVVFLEHDGTTATARRLDAARITKPRPRTAAPALATGPLAEVGVTRTPRGQVLLTGKAKASRTLPATVRVAAVPTDAEVSVDGSVVVDVTSDHLPVRGPDGSVDVTAPLSTLETRVTSLSTGRTVAVDAVVDGVAPGTAAPDAGAAEPTGADQRPLSAPPSRTLDRGVTAPSAVTTAADDPYGVHDTVDVGRGCSVPRNSLLNQTVQPKPRQVEWAVNQAVKGALTVQRPANWKNLQMPAYTPQGMFPSIPLRGGGEVPSQVMLGILAQESNLWQANGYVVPGVSGSPLIGNYYGIKNGLEANDPDRFNPDFAAVDCGYGVAQVTDGMRLADTGMPGGRSWNQQRAIALDFAANVAAGLQILQEKWNQTYDAGMKINGGDPSKIENWFYAIWAYNSGFYPEADKNTQERNGAWGVGWVNNPANPSYPPTRGFFHKNPADATHPQDWPYPERVIGFAAFPPSLLESPGTFVGAFRPAWWNGENTLENSNRLGAKPPVGAFCDPADGCVYMDSYGQCVHKNSHGVMDYRCWSHKPVMWKTNCSYSCGNPFIRFVAGYAYQEDGNAYPPVCGPTGLPSNALVIDDVPAGTAPVRSGCSSPATSAGTFRFTFSSADDPTEFPSKMDLHQLGAGYGAHFWFGHTRTEAVRNGSMEFTGTWTLDRPLDQWARVLVHLPDHGAHTQEANYRVHTGVGEPKLRSVLQRTERNGWVSLGVFDIDGVPKVSLSTETEHGDTVDGQGNPVTPSKNEDIAFDAVAFVPLPQRPKDIVVALGDSYSSGEGTDDYYAESNQFGNDPRYRNACHRSPQTWSRLATMPGSSQTIGQRADALDPTMDYHLLACSGAKTNQVVTDGQYQALSQLDRGFIDESTTRVTISIGGNDTGFSKIAMFCSITPHCHYNVITDGRSPYAAGIENKIADEVGPAVTETLLAIRDRGENAKVMLMGYPKLFSGHVCLDPVSIAIDASEVDWLNRVSELLNAEMSAAVDRANDIEGTEFATFASPVEAFDGKTICGGSPAYIHSVMWDKSESDESGWDDWWKPAAKGMHPTVDGYRAYAGVATSAFTAMGG